MQLSMSLQKVFSSKFLSFEDGGCEGVALIAAVSSVAI